MGKSGQVLVLQDVTAIINLFMIIINFFMIAEVTPLGGASSSNEPVYTPVQMPCRWTPLVTQLLRPALGGAFVYPATPLNFLF